MLPLLRASYMCIVYATYPSKQKSSLYHRKSFWEFKKSVYIHELLDKMFCNKVLYFSKILAAFRIYTVLKSRITNKIYRLGWERFGGFGQLKSNFKFRGCLRSLWHQKSYIIIFLFKYHIAIVVFYLLRLLRVYFAKDLI